MLAMDDEKLPPPTPADAAHSSSTHSCTSWLWCSNHPLGTTTASSSTGTNSSDELITVHFRPPNFGMANVYGMRNAEPMAFGTSVSRNCSDTDSVRPALARLITTVVQRTQIEKPMCS